MKIVHYTQEIFTIDLPSQGIHRLESLGIDVY